METMRKTDSRRGRIAYEVAGLAWLAEASDPGAAVVPVLDHGATWLEEPRLVSVSPTPRAAEEFGRALAQTHAAGASHLGRPRPDSRERAGWERHHCPYPSGRALAGSPRLVKAACDPTVRDRASAPRPRPLASRGERSTRISASLPT